MNARHISLLSQPWAYHPDMMDGLVLAVLRGEKKAESAAMTKAAAEAKTDIYGDPIRMPQMRGKVAVIPVDGAIVKGATRFDQMVFGMTSDEQIRGDMRSAIFNGAEAIVLDFRSPGGTVVGMSETAREVTALQESGFPIFAFTDTMMASKAMAIATGATGIFATPSAIVGSVGVIATALNVEQMLANFGVKVEVFSSGDLKSAGPVKEMTNAQRENVSSTVKALAQDFFDHVKAHRPGVTSEVFRGGHGDGKWALKNGLIDGIVSSIDELISNLSPA